MRWAFESTALAGNGNTMPSQKREIQESVSMSGWEGVKGSSVIVCYCMDELGGVRKDRNEHCIDGWMRAHRLEGCASFICDGGRSKDTGPLRNVSHYSQFLRPPHYIPLFDLTFKSLAQALDLPHITGGPYQARRRRNQYDTFTLTYNN